MADAKPAWTVTGQVEEYQPNDRGQYVPGYTVSFRTAAGQQGTVFVPRSDYNAPRVAEMVSAHAAAVDAVAALQG